MSQLFRITEEDLETLERELPAIVLRHPEICNNPETRSALDMMREIISKVRWDYGPPTEVRRIDA